MNRHAVPSAQARAPHAPRTRTKTLEPPRGVRALALLLALLVGESFLLRQK